MGYSPIKHISKLNDYPMRNDSVYSDDTNIRIISNDELSTYSTKLEPTIKLFWR